MRNLDFVQKTYAGKPKYSIDQGDQLVGLELVDFVFQSRELWATFFGESLSGALFSSDL